MTTIKRVTRSALAPLMMVACSAAYADTNTNEVVIDAPIEKVYEYVSQPERWHEWHPASLSADAGSTGVLKEGDTFSEKIRIYGQETQMSYKVLIASPPNEFKTEFTSPLIDGTIHYKLEKRGTGTYFNRTLNYSIDKYIVSMKAGMYTLSEKALGNLRGKLESDK